MIGERYSRNYNHLDIIAFQTGDLSGYNHIDVTAFQTADVRGYSHMGYLYTPNIGSRGSCGNTSINGLANGVYWNVSDRDGSAVE